jgi:hypothetical protein
MHAGVRPQIDQPRRRLDHRDQRRRDRVREAGQRDDGPVVQRIRMRVQQSGMSTGRGRNAVDDLFAASLGDVGDGFEE